MTQQHKTKVNWLVSCALTIFSVGAVAGSALAGDLDEVYIKSLSYGGSGCPQDTVEEYLYSNNQKFALVFNEFVALTGDDVARRERRKFCQVTLELHVPQGWSYAVSSFNQRAWAELDRGVSARLSATAYLNGGNGHEKATMIQGPMVGSIKVTDTLASEQLVWSECGKSELLNYKPEVRLTSRSSRAWGLVGTEYLTGRVETHFSLKWRKCK